MSVHTFDPVIKIPKRALVPSPPSGSNQRGQTALTIAVATGTGELPWLHDLM